MSTYLWMRRGAYSTGGGLSNWSQQLASMPQNGNTNGAIATPLDYGLHVGCIRCEQVASLWEGTVSTRCHSLRQIYLNAQSAIGSLTPLLRESGSASDCVTAYHGGRCARSGDHGTAPHAAHPVRDGHLALGLRPRRADTRCVVLSGDSQPATRCLPVPTSHSCSVSKQDALVGTPEPKNTICASSDLW